MCHGQASAAFPKPANLTSVFDAGIFALACGPSNATRRIGILPDIYGTNDFYRGLATRLAENNTLVYLVDIFHGLGDLQNPTRETAFARRNKVRDRDFVDSFYAFARQNSLTGVVGFCLGGLYVFELAKRDLPSNLVSFYGFPQGLDNSAPLAKPFDYLIEVKRPHTALFGDQDYSLGPDNLQRIRTIAVKTRSLSLKIYPGSGHGFLSDLDSQDVQLRNNARDALDTCERAVFS
jgi:carboxymethylenebutenolidase